MPRAPRALIACLSYAALLFRALSPLAEERNSRGIIERRRIAWIPVTRRPAYAPGLMRVRSHLGGLLWRRARPLYPIVRGLFAPPRLCPRLYCFREEAN